MSPSFAMRLFTFFCGMLAVHSADLHVELRLLRREEERMAAEHAHEGRLSMQISSSAETESNFVGERTVAKVDVEHWAEVYDVNSTDIPGFACPNGDSALNYEDDCRWLRDNGPLGWSLSLADMKYHAENAHMVRSTSFLAQLPPNDIYNSWVLSYRILAEEPYNWRMPFYAQLSQQLMREQDMVLAVQHLVPTIWSLRMTSSFVSALGTTLAASTANKPITFQAGSANIRVTDVVKNGVASSLGLSTYVVAALRSIGIPARVVGVNKWGTQAQGAYYWVEFWTCRAPDGSDVWSFFDADPSATQVMINRAWFVPAFTQFAITGSDSAIFAGTFDRSLASGVWNVSLPSTSTRTLLVPAVDITYWYRKQDPVTTTTTLSTFVDLADLAKAVGINSTTTTTTTTLYTCRPAQPDR